MFLSVSVIFPSSLATRFVGVIRTLLSPLFLPVLLLFQLLPFNAIFQPQSGKRANLGGDFEEIFSLFKQRQYVPLTAT